MKNCSKCHYYSFLVKCLFLPQPYFFFRFTLMPSKVSAGFATTIAKYFSIECSLCIQKRCNIQVFHLTARNVDYLATEKTILKCQWPQHLKSSMTGSQIFAFSNGQKKAEALNYFEKNYLFKKSIKIFIAATPQIQDGPHPKFGLISRLMIALTYPKLMKRFTANLPGGSEAT